MSSLAAQLAQGASLNSSLLVDRSRRKATESYLFTGRDTDLHDLDSIHALGNNGLLQLALVDPIFRTYEGALFSDAARETDRTLLPTQAIHELDKSIASLLARLGPYLLDAPTGKVIEWLVRRFRINEFNLESILTLFLPYHESPHFAKMVTILHIKPNSIWDFLLAFKKAAQSVPRLALVKEMLKNSEVARFIATLLPAAIKSGHSHRTLLAFNAATLHDYLAHLKKLDDGTAAFMLPALLEPLQNSEESPKDAILGSYILLATMSHKCTLTPAAIKVIVVAMTTCAQRVSAKQYISAVVSVCEAQSEIEALSAENTKSVLAIPGLTNEVRAAAGWVGIEKVLNPLVTSLASDLEDGSHAEMLEAILIAPNSPKQTISLICDQLLPLAVEPSVVISQARHLLRHVHQRYSEILHEALDRANVSNEDLKQDFDQLIVSLSMNKKFIPKPDDANADMVIAASSADSKVRIIATKSLVSMLSKDDISADDAESARSALRAQTQDSDSSVLEALYEHHEIILPILLQDPSSYIEELSTLFSSAKPKRSVLRTHLAFLTSHFAPKAGLKDIYNRLLFPLMLWSKPRQHSVEAVWDAIEKNLPKSGSGSFELLSGCADLWASAKADHGDGQEKMASFNMALASRISENILSSNDFSSHVKELIAKFGDENTHVRLLAYLIGRALLRRLTGGHQIDAALELVQALNLDQMHKAEESVRGLDDLQEHLSDDSICKNIAAKPNSKNTMYWVQLSLTTAAAEVRQPEGVVVNWLIESTTPGSTDDRDYRYVTLMRRIYKIANQSTTSVMMNTLRVLFANIGDDALAFLTGVWLTQVDDDELVYVTFEHYAALLEAFKSSEVVIDFQTILPSLLVALQSPDIKIRQYAQRCLTLISEGTQAKFQRVYAFDIIYGSSSVQLVYLSQDDLTKYLTSLVAHFDHFLHDSGYIVNFHREYLSQKSSDKRKTADHKRNVLCYLASHINASNAKCQHKLFNSISNVTDTAKAALLQASVKALLVLPGQYDKDLDQYASHLASLFDTSSYDDLNNDKDGLWSTYCDFFTYLLDNVELRSAKALAIHLLEHGLFDKLNGERQFELCSLLLGLASESNETHLTVTKLLVVILHQPLLAVRLLHALQPDPVDGPPASKRAKANNDTPEDNIPRLSVLAEVLSTASMPGSFDIIVALVQTLNNVIQASMASDVADIAFIEQSLMSAISNTAEKVTEAPNVSPPAIRLEVLVDLIRTADNPQTFQQALLLMATLARLTPDSVLQNIMPVFTFMGSNVFHRDDTYSFTVVQKTVDNIVPVMVASLKHSHTSRMELLLGSREFLQVFTDAANHIPRHRRTNFFVHLVNVLGAEDYLTPVCLLLVEKAATRVVRQNEKEAQATLTLPISVLQHYDGSLQNKALGEMVQESKRLAARVTDPENLEPAFLDDNLNEEHATSAVTALKRRAQAILTFAGLAVKTTSGFSSTDEESLVSLLVGMYTFKSGQGADARIDDINKAAKISLNKTLRVMPASDYLKSTLRMLQSPHQPVQIGSLELLAERLPQVSDSVRQSASADLIQIIQRIKNIISSHPGSPVAIAGFKAVKTIGSSMSIGEESSLTELVPVLLAVIRERKMAQYALPALSPLAARLGPRIIPYFKDVVGQCIAVLEENLEDLAEHSTDVLRGLLTSIPTFWAGNEIAQVVTLYITRRKTDTSLASIVKAITKRASEKVVLTTLTSMWTSLVASGASAETYDLFFDVLRRSLRTSSKAVVQQNLRPIFNMLLEALDVLKPQTQKAAIISAFTELTVNLNENTFRPLFRRFYDWGFVGDDVSRRITFCRVFSALLDYFKALMTPYTSFVLPEFIAYWTSSSTTSAGSLNAALWTSIIGTTAKSMAHDDGVFWQDDKIKQAAPPLLAQVPLCLQVPVEGRSLLQDTLSALVENASDDILLKKINLDLLMHTRSEDVQVRLFALGCARGLWEAHGGKLLGFAAETSTFIAECSEDENDMICREAINLKGAVESVAGSIQGL